MKVQPKVALGVVGAMLLGGFVTGRKFARLDPTHAAAFGVAAVVSSFIIHKAMQWWYGETYKNLDFSLKVITCLSIATLITGGLAESYFAVRIPIPAALKIMTGSLTTGFLGWLFGAYVSRDPSTPSEPSAPLQDPVEGAEKMVD